MIKPSQIAVEAANGWLGKTVTIGVQESLCLAFQAAIDKATEELQSKLTEALTWKEEDPRMLREQCRVSDVAFQHQFEERKKAEAGCAEMREVLESVKEFTGFCICQCGKNYIPIEDVKPLLETMMMNKEKQDFLAKHGDKLK